MSFSSSTSTVYSNIGHRLSLIPRLDFSSSSFKKAWSAVLPFQGYNKQAVRSLYAPSGSLGNTARTQDAARSSSWTCALGLSHTLPHPLTRPRPHPHHFPPQSHTPHSSPPNSDNNPPTPPASARSSTRPSTKIPTPTTPAPSD